MGDNVFTDSLRRVLRRKLETGSVLISYCYCNITRNCLKTTQMYYLVVLESISPKIKLLTECFLMEVLGENLFPCLFQLLVTICNTWFIIPSSTFEASKVASPN